MLECFGYKENKVMREDGQKMLKMESLSNGALTKPGMHDIIY